MDFPKSQEPLSGPVWPLEGLTPLSGTTSPPPFPDSQWVPPEPIPALSGESVGGARGGALAPTARPARLSDAARKVLLTRGIRKRRSVPIIGYVGLNGSFKTATMVRDTLPSLALGRRVLSTVMILDPQTGLPHDLYVPFHSWAQLLAFKDGDVLLDEVTGIMDSRDSGMPKAVRRILPQMRRRNVVIRWTGIDWDNSDKRLRQITKAVVTCRGYLPKSIEAATDDTLPMWAPNRLAFVTTYDASTMTSTEDGAQQLTQERSKKRRAKVLNRELYWGPGSRVFASYDTLAEVSQVQGGCPICGRPIREPLCSKPDEHAAEFQAEAQRAGTGA